ncbi:MAG TPA: GNAT family N-acetyltransferase [Chthoniobacteraceae bacterium]|nr:GNAT family N-acetyltransferase [Chthoniobacteraceae bacterium]
MSRVLRSYSFELSEFDFDAIRRWLSGTYWSPGISRERVEKGFRASALCIGAFEDGRQVGVARCVSDTTRFAYIADVFVDEACRGRGIAKEMVKRLIEHPLVADTDKFYLHTVDAHRVYEGLGFKLFSHPERVMVREKGI